MRAWGGNLKEQEEFEEGYAKDYSSRDGVRRSTASWKPSARRLQLPPFPGAQHGAALRMREPEGRHLRAPPPPPDRTAHASSGLPALLDPHHPRAAERAHPTPRMRKAPVPRRNGGKPPAGFAAGVAHVRTAPPSGRAAPHHEGGGGAAPGPPEPRDRAGPRRLPCRPPQRHPGLGPASTGCPAFLQRPRGWGRA